MTSNNPLKYTNLKWWCKLQSVAFKVCHGKTWFISWLCHFHTRLDILHTIRLVLYVYYILICKSGHQLKIRVDVWPTPSSKFSLHFTWCVQTKPDTWHWTITRLDTILTMIPLQVLDTCLVMKTEWKGLEWEDHLCLVIEV